ncbi:MAG TPA: Rid family detoxifying hydrolase [Candidatus Limnocylindria bacterium]
MRTQIETSAAPPATGAYSQAIRAGGFVFAAGQLGADPATGELADGVAAQAERALLNLTAVLDAAGVSLDRVVKTTIFLSDMANFAAVNEAYARHFPAPYPARATIAVRELPRGGLVEIEAIAIAPDG